MPCKECFNCVSYFPVANDPLDTKIIMQHKDIGQEVYCKAGHWVDVDGITKSYTINSVDKNTKYLQEVYENCPDKNEEEI